MEDLFAFNTEEVVRAVADCRIPTISAVGHETDWTLSDFAADLRAPTPSAAAELAVPDQKDLQKRLALFESSAIKTMADLLENRRRAIARLETSRSFRTPTVLLEERELKLDRLIDKLESAETIRMEKARHALQKVSASLDALSPLSTLARGYTVTYREENCDKKMLFNAASVKQNNRISVRFRDGYVHATADQIELIKK